MSLSLTDRVAVITGAGRGIGRGIALEFARRGAIVILNYNASLQAANEAVELIRASGGTGVAVQADVSKLPEAERLIQTALDQFERLDILVNNAGISRSNMMIRMTEDDWDTVLDNNLKSAWNCSKAALRSMVRRRYGRIINITSLAAILGLPMNANYAASKAGMIGLTKTLSREVGSRQITVNSIAPGFVHTDMTAPLTEDMVGEITKDISLERWGTVEDIAYAAAFLVSDEAAYITGQVLQVDGGYHG